MIIQLFIVFICNVLIQRIIYTNLSYTYYSSHDGKVVLYSYCDFTEALSNKPERKWKMEYQWLFWRPYLMFVPFGYVLFLLAVYLMRGIISFKTACNTFKDDLTVSKYVCRKRNLV